MDTQVTWTRARARLRSSSVVTACLALVIVLAGLAGPSAASGAEVQRAGGANLRGLDRIAGSSRVIPLQVGESAMLGPLRVTLAECRYPPADPASEAFAWLTIRDERSETVLFDGWMIATSPALNALDHARYDVWVLGCRID